MSPISMCERNVLVVDRSMASAMFLEVRLVQGGYVVQTAHSLEHALELAHKAPLDDALIDVCFDGADLIVGALKARQIPFIYHAGSHGRTARHS